MTVFARREIAALFLGLVLLPRSPVYAGDGKHFVAGIEDLPVMPGLESLPEESVVFDKPEGRIVEVLQNVRHALGRGALDEAEVLEFYGRTLPELGWQKLSDSRFQREGEVLSLELTQSGDGLLVAFRLAPAEG